MIRGKAGGHIVGVMFTGSAITVRFENNENWSRRAGTTPTGSYTTKSRSGKSGTNFGVVLTNDEFEGAVTEAVDLFFAVHSWKRTS